MTSLTRGLFTVPFVVLLSAPALAADNDGPVNPEIPRLVDQIKPNLPSQSRPPSSPSSSSSSGSGNNSRANSSKNNNGNEKPKPEPEEPESKLDEKHAWGAYGSRALAGGFISEGEDITRTLPTGAGVNPSTVPAERKYSRPGGYIELAFATDNTKIFDDAVLLGAELWMNASVLGGSRYKDGTFLKDKDNDDKKLGFALRGDGIVSISPLNWGGPIAGRITIFPGVGGVLDNGRYYGSYVYLMGGGRVSLLFGGKIALHGQYVIAPFTSSSAFSVLEHRIEGSFSYRKFVMGFRAQLDAIGEDDVKATTGAPKEVTNTTFGGFMGFGFK